jgi:hypothetical protein
VRNDRRCPSRHEARRRLHIGTTVDGSCANASKDRLMA